MTIAYQDHIYCVEHAKDFEDLHVCLIDYQQDIMSHVYGLNQRFDPIDHFSNALETNAYAFKMLTEIHELHDTPIKCASLSPADISNITGEVMDILMYSYLLENAVCDYHGWKVEYDHALNIENMRVNVVSAVSPKENNTNQRIRSIMDLLILGRDMASAICVNWHRADKVADKARFVSWLYNTRVALYRILYTFTDNDLTFMRNVKLSTVSAIQKFEKYMGTTVDQPEAKIVEGTDQRKLFVDMEPAVRANAPMYAEDDGPLTEEQMDKIRSLNPDINSDKVKFENNILTLAVNNPEDPIKYKCGDKVSIEAFDLFIFTDCTEEQMLGMVRNCVLNQLYPEDEIPEDQTEND